MDRNTSVRTEQQFLYTLQQVVESYPHYTVAQHLLHFLRQKSEKKEPYFWSTELLLQKLEAYYDELKDMAIEDAEEDDEDDDYL